MLIKIIILNKKCNYIGNIFYVKIKKVMFSCISLDAQLYAIGGR